MRKQSRRLLAGAGILAIALVAPTVSSTKGNVESDHDRDKGQSPRVVAVIESGSKTGEGRLVETRFRDGSGKARNMQVIDLDDPALKPKACGPRVTDADIERWMFSGQTDDEPIGTGPDACKTKRNSRSVGAP